MTDRISIDQQIEELETELKIRADVFPRLVRTHKMRQSVADFRNERLNAAITSLKWLKENRPIIVEWVKSRPAKAKDAA